MVGKATYDFTDQSALVTGSTSGIGRGIATALAQAGADVAVNARTERDVEKTAAELNEIGDGRAIGVPADLRMERDIERLVGTVLEEFDRLDVLVNNAAIWPMEDSMTDAPLEEWDDTMAVNVRSQYHASKLVARHMIDAGIDGCIINVTSQTGDRRAGNRGLYGVSNTAVNGLTWRMADELAEHGIRMNAVSTDVTESRQLRTEAELEADGTDRRADDVLQEWGRDRPIGRLGQPKDLADAVLYLASDRAEYVVGHVLRVSGGGNLQ